MSIQGESSTNLSMLLSEYEGQIVDHFLAKVRGIREWIVSEEELRKTRALYSHRSRRSTSPYAFDHRHFSNLFRYGSDEVITQVQFFNRLHDFNTCMKQSKVRTHLIGFDSATSDVLQTILTHFQRDQSARTVLFRPDGNKAKLIRRKIQVFHVRNDLWKRRPTR